MTMEKASFGKISLVLAMAAILALFSLGPSLGHATTYWDYLDTGDWHYGANWSDGVPTGTTDAIIDNHGTAQIHSADAYSQDLFLGYTASGSGQVEIKNNYGLTSRNLYVGYGGTGTFTLSGGGQEVTNNLYLGAEDYGRVGSGTYNLEDGNLSANNEYIGYGGTGTFTQSGGNHGVTNNLYLGFQLWAIAMGSGTYDLEDGSLSVSNAHIGAGGIGTFNQSGGNLEVTNDLYVGDHFVQPGFGVYNLEDGYLSASNEYIGAYAGTGIFTQSGGTNKVANTLYVGYMHAGSDPGIGTYNLKDGNLSASNVIIGSDVGIGTFTQSGGTNTVTNALVVGGYDGIGTYNLEDGSLSASNAHIGYGGTGTFNQSGGDHEVTNNLYLGFQLWYAMGSGTYNLSGGEATVSGHVSVGADSLFSQTGGTFTATDVENRGHMEFDGSSGTGLSTNIDNLTNAGEVQVTQATLTLGNYSGSGSYHSDSATTMVLADLSVGPDGYLVGGAGDIWQIGGNFYNTSTMNTQWDTSQSILAFNGGDHTLQIPGLDRGANFYGYTNNFAWGTLDVTGQELTLSSAFDSDAALYLGRILGLVFDDLTIANIYSSEGLNLYYNAALNPYLGGLAYNLTAGGRLIPAVVPLPGSVWLLVLGLVGLAVVQRRRVRNLGRG
jgi:hypothetical protein